MNSGQTSDRVYDTLKHRLMAGEYRPGERLDPSTLAASMNASVTPVRDALHRLIGERMIETRTGTGFHLAALYEPDLRDLYTWTARLLLEAMHWWRTSPVAQDVPDLSGPRTEATRALFRYFGTHSSSREIAAAIDASSDRLGAVREIEERTIDPPSGELFRIAGTFEQERAAIAREVRAYHKRRLAAVPALVTALHRAA